MGKEDAETTALKKELEDLIIKCQVGKNDHLKERKKLETFVKITLEKLTKNLFNSKILKMFRRIRRNKKTRHWRRHAAV